MIAEAIDKILSLSRVDVQEIIGLPYASRPMHLVAPPDVSPITLVTLTGLVDWIAARPDGLDPSQWIAHVENHQSVQLIHRTADPYGRRTLLAKSVLQDAEVFPFGRWLHCEEFVIGLQSRFVASADFATVLRLASNLQAATVTTAEDDGISQRTTVRQGVTLMEIVTVKGRVLLRPYRTFREIEQPSSEFVFRLKSHDGGVPQCGLFEADGGTWKLHAVLAIKAWLESQALGMPVIA